MTHWTTEATREDSEARRKMAPWLQQPAREGKEALS